MSAIFKHELRGYFHSMTAYVCGAFLLAFVGLGSMLYNLQKAVSNFEFVLGFSSIAFAVVVPILTMRVISEERKQKTDQLLYALPITTSQVIVGKYLALLVVFAVPVAIISIYPLVFSHFGDVYLPSSYGSLLAFFLVGAALIALGVFISSLTENQGLAAGVGIAVILFNYFSVDLAEYVSATSFGSALALVLIVLGFGGLIHHMTRDDRLANIVCFGLMGLILVIFFLKPEIYEGLLPTIMRQLSLFDRLTVFINGVFDIRALIYFGSVIALFLFLSVQSLEKRRYN